MTQESRKNIPRRSGRSRYSRKRPPLWRRFLGPFITLSLIALVIMLYLVLLVPDSRIQVGHHHDPPMPPARERTLDLPPLELPRDEAPHVSATEWWYYSGHLFGDQGEHYSFHVTVFLRDGLVRHTVFHGSLTDHDNGQRHGGQHRTAGIPSSANAEGFDFHYANWQVSGSGDEHVIIMQEEDFQLTLALTDPWPAVLHKAHGSAPPGLVDFGEAGISYYYSRPRMRAHGQVRVGREAPVSVAGEVWFDHQWGDFEASRLGWHWFALHLEDDSELMIYVLYDQHGEHLTTLGTRSRQGRSEAIASDQVRVRGRGEWISPQSNLRYPAAWDIDLPEGRLHIEPLHQDSEFDGRESIFTLYWEGGVEVSGALEGLGFVEMHVQPFADRLYR
ncbi:lipocalin family protein [Ectothiorhodospira sp. BSL-9]|uniref:lipocalin family protein n=1 Tax=Ectothiorhodospira sp. BSL-9 TaxID=1442136 RepID=UPI00143BA52A|nr:lipocalin family protein [Ectothiorhodospira sp. BSL-9]